MSNIIITGANRGIGLSLTENRLKAGHNVIATARNPSDAEDLDNLSKSFPGKLTILPLEVTNDESIRSFADAVEDKMSKVDVLINNAGIGIDANKLGGITREVMSKVLDVNTISPLMVTQALLPRLKAADAPLVVHISSVLGSIGNHDNGSGWANYAYNSSKSALNMIGTMMSQELKPYGIGVLILHPGWVRTRLGGDDATLSTEESAHGMMTIIDNFNLNQSGDYLDPHGNPIPW